MRASVQKWGNSLALRIPKSLATESKLGSGTSVELSLVDGKIVVSPVAAKEYKLKDLLAGVTKKNVHREINTGRAMGKEVCHIKSPPSINAINNLWWRGSCP